MKRRLLLSTTIVSAATVAASLTLSAAPLSGQVLAQAAPSGEQEQKKPGARPPGQPAPAAPHQAAPPQPAPPARQEPPHPPTPPTPPTPPRGEHAAPPQPPAQRRIEEHAAPPQPPAQRRIEEHAAPPQQQRPSGQPQTPQPSPAPRIEERTLPRGEQRPLTPSQPQPPSTPRTEERALPPGQNQRPTTPAQPQPPNAATPNQNNVAPNQLPSGAQRPPASGQQQTPQQQAPLVTGPRDQLRPGAAGAPNQGNPPAPIVQRAAPTTNPAAVPPPTQAINKQQFLAPRGQAPTAGLNQLRDQRREVREGNRVFIHEPDRTIVEEDNRVIIRHNEVDRFAVDARDVHVERRGNETVSIVVRPDGLQIINYTDDEGRLLRRVRRDRDGREIIIIDNTYISAQPAPVFLNIPPPVIRIPRERYIVDADRADEAVIYETLDAPPVEPITSRYTLEQIRYNAPLREWMPRIDLDINFDTGSWQLTPDQVDRLAYIAQAINRAIQRNPREVFLIEGHTDAVGSDVDNLSLSDRRAESVAVALTEQFQVPPENLVTQGYGKQDLKVPTDGPEPANRRVAIRRITPLLDAQQR